MSTLLFTYFPEETTGTSGPIVPIGADSWVNLRPNFQLPHIPGNRAVSVYYFHLGCQMFL